MKTTTIILIILNLLFTGIAANGQIVKPEKVVKKQGTRRANNRIEQGVDKGFDKLEEGIGGLFKKKKKKKNEPRQEESNSTVQSQSKPGGGTSNSVKGKDADALFAEHGMYPPSDAADVTIPVTLKWTAMNGNGFRAARYEVYISEKGNNEDKMLGAPKKPQITCSDLKPNTTYSWKYVGQSSGGQYMPGGGGTFTTGDGKAVARMNVRWSKFDFVPGDEVIFEDAPSSDEENGEFPSRWDLIDGQVEIANVNGEAVLMFLDGGKIIPYLKNSDKDYLSEVFTVEFDFYRPKDGNRISVYLTDQKNQSGNGVYKNGQEFDITPIRVDAPGGVTAEHAGRDYTYCENGCWTHVSIAYTKGKLKVYLDDTRVINIPHYEFNPTGFTFYPYFADAGENKPFYAKNFRIAKGGVKYYDRVLQDGKIIVNGIRFDIGKATIKPESNGAINKIFKLMQKQADLNFSVEGHTDADGDDTNNMTLSKARGKAVMNRLIEMGIAANRLKSTGYGESKPVDNNTTAEGKANNRRVEFVKIN